MTSQASPINGFELDRKLARQIRKTYYGDFTPRRSYRLHVFTALALGTFAFFFGAASAFFA